MAIGMTAAILGSAAIGAFGSAVASGNNSRAINDATEAQQEGNAASLALQERVYDQNRATLSPFVNRGNVAGDHINALLGLGGAQAQPAPQTNPNALTGFGSTGTAGLPYGLGDGYIGPASVFGGGGRGFNPPGYGDIAGTFGGYTGAPQFPQTGNPASSNTPTGATAPVGQTPQGAANDAFDIFRNSTGYQFRLGEGMDAVNSNWFGSGLGQSGAALRALTEYGQNFASNEFGNYMGYLSQQQGTGLQAAGAQAGVGVNYANSAANINQANANALANSAVASANNNNALIGGITGAVGNAIGGLAYRPQG